MDIDLGKQFKIEFKNFPASDKKKIVIFIKTVQSFESFSDFASLPGRNKNSNEVSTEDSDFMAKTALANKFHLWHYHIGIPKYDATDRRGKRTSNYVVHYKLVDQHTIVIVDMTEHPIKLPSEKYLE